MVPAPLPKKPEVEVDQEIDTAIARIDQCLPEIHKRVEQSKRSGDTPSSAFQPQRIMQTQRKFQAMVDDPILTESGLDIQVEAPARVNGAED